MWFLIPAIPVALSLLVLFALSPAGMVALILRLLLFFIAAGAWLLYALVPVISHSGTQPFSIWMPIGCTVPWLLTFLPLRRLLRRSSQ